MCWLFLMFAPPFDLSTGPHSHAHGCSLFRRWVAAAEMCTCSTFLNTGSLQCREQTRVLKCCNMPTGCLSAPAYRFHLCSTRVFFLLQSVFGPSPRSLFFLFFVSLLPGVYLLSVFESFLLIPVLSCSWLFSLYGLVIPVSSQSREILKEKGLASPLSVTPVILKCVSNGLIASRFFYTVAATIRTAAGNKTKYKRSLVVCNLSVQCVTGKWIHSLLYVLILQSWMVGSHKISHDLKGTSGTQSF